MTEGQEKIRNLVKEKATEEELKSPETSRKLLKIRKGTRENFGK